MSCVEWAKAYDAKSPDINSSLACCCPDHQGINMIMKFLQIQKGRSVSEHAQRLNRAEEAFRRWYHDHALPVVGEKEVPLFIKRCLKNESIV